MSDQGLTPFDATAEELLLEHLLDGASRGRVVLKDDGVDIAIYVDKGTILAAEASDDARLLLRRVKLDGLLDAAAARKVEIELAKTKGIGPILDAIATDGLETPLRDRFVDNVARAVTSRSAARYEDVPTPFVDNLQLVYNAQGLVADCKQLGEVARSLDEEIDLAVGPRSPGDERQARVIDLVNQGITRAGNVADRLPEEPLAARALVAELLELSVVLRTEDAARRAAMEAIPLEPVATRAGSLPSMPFVDLGVIAPPSARDGKSFSPEAPAPSSGAPGAPDPSAVATKAAPPAAKPAPTGDDDEGPSIPIVPVVLAFVMLFAVMLGVYLALG